MSTTNTEPTVIKRDGLPPIRAVITHEWSDDNSIQGGNHANRWTEVAIYKTKGGKYIAKISRKTQWQGESDTCDADVFSTPHDVIRFLKEGEDRLGGVSQGAVEKACEQDEAFAAAYVVDVE